MKIKRTIDGVEYEFELTTGELSEAYTEVQHQFDCDDVADVLESMIGGGDIYGYDPMPNDDELRALVPKMASLMRRELDKGFDDWWDYAVDAIYDVISEKYGQPY